MNIGVLALQGDFDAHRRRLAELGAEAFLVRSAGELGDADALVIPGGESTTFLKLMEEGVEGRGQGAGEPFSCALPPAPSALFAALRRFVAEKPVFGTCAGAILLARDVENPPQPTLAALDVRIRRNAYGRQLDSSIRRGEFRGSPMEMVFIRAPKIVAVGPDVEVLATEADNIVAVRQGHVVAATFHPELSDDVRLHALFLEMVEGKGLLPARGEKVRRSRG